MKYLKYIAGILLLILVAGFFLLKFFSEEKPHGNSGPEADKLAMSMLVALGKEAFDTIPYLEFEFFAGGHKYFWDKKNNQAIVAWDNIQVVLDLDQVSGVATKNGESMSGTDQDEAIQTAWSYWCNDSFWMIAPFKCFDPGTTRKVVIDEDGKNNLLLEYASGGVTPGDSYLWILDDQNVPSGWKMWTQILPVKGAYTSWEGWETMMGAKLSTKHKLAGKEVSMKGVRVGKNWAEFGYETDPFATLD